MKERASTKKNGLKTQIDEKARCTLLAWTIKSFNTVFKLFLVEFQSHKRQQKWSEISHMDSNRTLLSLPSCWSQHCWSSFSLSHLKSVKNRNAASCFMWSYEMKNARVGWIEIHIFFIAAIFSHCDHRSDICLKTFWLKVACDALANESCWVLLSTSDELWVSRNRKRFFCVHRTKKLFLKNLPLIITCVHWLVSSNWHGLEHGIIEVQACVS